jgi:hypothetical protein
VIAPGKLIKIIISDVNIHPHDSYDAYGETHIDKNLRTVNALALIALRKHDVWITVESNDVIVGRSWEMACIMASWTQPNGQCYTGKVKSVSSNDIVFTHVRGVPIKKLLCTDILTPDEIPFIRTL